MKNIKSILIIPFFILIFNNCTEEQTTPSNAQFELLTKEQTGLDFENILTQSIEFNVFAYMYFYNGGGIAAGDFNNDGLEDLFFTSNMESNKLFINEGGMKFKDVTEIAGLVGQSGWTTGASAVDINNDGMLDIYVSQMSGVENITGTNQFYICKKIENGVPIFEDKAAEYGLDLAGFATQASFFDYDLDGDLDMYQLNHSLHANGTFGKKKLFDNTNHEQAGDRLMRNDSENGVIKFTDVTDEEGIHNSVIGYGLGIVTGDVNLDGYPDIYIGNDFHENDYLYLNRGAEKYSEGTFREALTEQMMHTSRFSMGVDMADLNNDGWSEIVSLDMLAYDPFILKSSLGEDEYRIFKFKLGYGYNPQFARNNLQLNNQNGTFSEVGMMAGVYATDWSWAPLLVDFDYDGNKDLFIANGIPRRMNDIDYVNFRMGDEDIKFKTAVNHIEDEEELAFVEKMPQIKLPNKIYKNDGSLQFSDLENTIKNNLPSYSNGAIYADLDNDGDLDFVVNNIDDAPFIYKNLAMERADSTANYLHFKYKGSPNNINGIGAKIIVERANEQLVSEHYPVRGYQSSVALGTHIGLGENTDIQRVTVIWSDRTFEEITEFQLNKTTVLEWKPNLPEYDFSQLNKREKTAFQFEEATEKSGLDFQHEENPFVEFNRESLIPYAVSTEGPALAIGDINGDGLEDIFFGNSKRKRSALYIQNANGTFSNQTPQEMAQDSLLEDVDAVFVDIENDGDLDLVIASGGNEWRGENPARTHRTYLNDNGKLNSVNLFPEAFSTGACIEAADFNGDGLVDFFIGSRAEPYKYGIAPESFLYENKGGAKFELVTDKYAKDLKNVGMIKDGKWADIDSDGDQDLVLVIDYQPIIIFKNNGDSFEKTTINDLKGWWNFVLPYDFDGDGDVDLLAGNVGKNSKLKPTKTEPIRNYINDFDANGQLDQILTYYLGGREIAFHNHAELTKQLVTLKKKYLMSKDMAKASLEEIFGKDKLAEATVLEANFMPSVYFENTGNPEKSGQSSNFKTHILPDELQISTLNAAHLTDLNNDGKMEVILGGNFYDSNIEMGRYDADFGNILSIGENGRMTVSPLKNTPIKGQIRNIETVKTADGQYIIFARNDEKVKVLKVQNLEN